MEVSLRVGVWCFFVCFVWFVARADGLGVSWCAEIWVPWLGYGMEEVRYVGTWENVCNV